MTVYKNEQVSATLVCSPKGKLHPREVEESFSELLLEERFKAHQAGKVEGEKAGYEKAKEEMGALFQLLQALSKMLLESKERLFEQLKPAIIEFSLAISERVIRIELSQPEKLAKLIESFLNWSSPSFSGEVLKVFLAPEDLVMLESHLQLLHYDKQEIKGIRFASDALQRRGDVRIEGKSALLNFMLARELEDLRSKIMRQ